MAYSVKEFLARKIEKSLEELCISCKKPIGNDNINYKIGKKPVCEDCYYDLLSECLENYPVGKPGNPRFY